MVCLSEGTDDAASIEAHQACKENVSPVACTPAVCRIAVQSKESLELPLASCFLGARPEGFLSARLLLRFIARDCSLVRWQLSVD